MVLVVLVVLVPTTLVLLEVTMFSIQLHLRVAVAVERIMDCLRLVALVAAVVERLLRARVGLALHRKVSLVEMEMVVLPRTTEEAEEAQARLDKTLRQALAVTVGMGWLRLFQAQVLHARAAEEAEPTRQVQQVLGERVVAVMVQSELRLVLVTRIRVAGVAELGTRQRQALAVPVLLFSSTLKQ